MSASIRNWSRFSFSLALKNELRCSTETYAWVLEIAEVHWAPKFEKGFKSGTELAKHGAPIHKNSKTGRRNSFKSAGHKIFYQISSIQTNPIQLIYSNSDTINLIPTLVYSTVSVVQRNRGAAE